MKELNGVMMSDDEFWARVQTRIGDLVRRVATFREEGCRTYKVWRYTLADAEIRVNGSPKMPDPTAGWDQVSLPRNAAFDRIKEEGGDPEHLFIIVRSAINDGDPDYRTKKAILENILENGLDVPDFVDTKCRHFELATAGASMIRYSGFMMAAPAVIKDLLDKAFAGFSPEGKKVAPNKVLAYSGLQLSASRPLREVYGFDFDVRKIVVVPAGRLKIRRRCDVVAKDGSKVDLDVDRELTMAFDDGMAVIAAEIFKLATAPSLSFRASVGAFKGLAVPVKDLQGWFRENGITQIRDIWGAWHPVEDVQVIMSETCFKQASWTPSWGAFCDAFEARNGHFRVCVVEHPAKKSRISYQFLQTLIEADEASIKYLGGRAKTALDAYKDPANACSLVGGDAAKAASRYPKLLELAWFKRTMQSAYTSRRQQALGGSVPATGSYAFAACDPIAFLQNACGLPVTGCLKEGEVCCSEGGGGFEVDVCRSPQLDHSHVVLRNRTHNVSKYIVRNSTMYFNVWDETTIRLRMDYDGDHVWWTQNQFIINMVRRTNRLIDMRVTDWDAPEAGKPVFTWELAKDMLLRNTQGSQIGIFADNSTRVWSRYEEIVDRFGLDGFRTVVAWLTWAGNVLIDAAKHGSVSMSVPAIVENCINDSFEVQTLEDGRLVKTLVFDDIEDAVGVLENFKRNRRKGVRYKLVRNKAPLPAFCEYAKADKDRPVGCEHWQEACLITGGVGDRYMLEVARVTDEELALNQPSGFDFKKDWQALLFDPHRKKTNLEGLWAQGDRIEGKDGEEDRWINQGLFQQIAGQRRDEIKAMDLDPQIKAMMLSDRSEVARQSIRIFAEERGRTLQAAYDCIARELFKTNWANETEKGHSKGWCNTLFLTFFSIFGEEVLAALAQNGYSERILAEEEVYTDEDLYIDDL